LRGERSAQNSRDLRLVIHDKNLAMVVAMIEVRGQFATCVTIWIFTAPRLAQKYLDDCLCSGVLLTPLLSSRNL
jgi:hypothetical protein